MGEIIPFLKGKPDSPAVPAPVELTAHTGWPETCFACAVAHRAGSRTVTGEVRIDE